MVVIRQKSDEHQMNIRWTSASYQTVIRESSDFIRQSSDGHQTVIRHSSDSHQIVIKQSSDDNRWTSDGHQTYKKIYFWTFIIVKIDIYELNG